MPVEILFSEKFETVEEAVLAEWKKRERDYVNKGEIIAHVETYKANIEVEAPENGIITEIRIKEGEVFEYPAVLGMIDINEQFHKEERTGDQERIDNREKKLSPAAKKYADTMGIPINEIYKKISKTIIKKRDIEDFIGNSPEYRNPSKTLSTGRLSKEFISRLKEDAEAQRVFSMLPSGLKVCIYKQSGACIGEEVTIDSGSIIIADRIVVENGTIIKKDCRIESEEVEIGKMAFFEDKILWKCRKISLGDMFYGSSESRVGWGGEWNSNAELIIGDHCFIGEQAMLNPAQGIYMQNNVAIGAGSKIYTHQFWHSVLEGYHALHAPVHIQSNTQIGANVVILPGVRIGKGVLVAANSTVTHNIQDNRLAGGIPAAAISKTAFPKKLTNRDRVFLIKRLLKDFLNKQGYDADVRTNTLESFEWTGERVKMIFIPDRLTKEIKGDYRCFLISSNPIDDHMIDNPNATVFDLKERKITGIEDEASDLLREFFRKQGVRFTPPYWRYKYKEGVKL